MWLECWLYSIFFLHVCREIGIQALTFFLTVFSIMFLKNYLQMYHMFEIYCFLVVCQYVKFSGLGRSRRGRANEQTKYSRMLHINSKRKNEPNCPNLKLRLKRRDIVMVETTWNKTTADRFRITTQIKLINAKSIYSLQIVT